MTGFVTRYNRIQTRRAMHVAFLVHVHEPDNFSKHFQPQTICLSPTLLKIKRRVCWRRSCIRWFRLQQQILINLNRCTSDGQVKPLSQFFRRTRLPPFIDCIVPGVVRRGDHTAAPLLGKLQQLHAAGQAERDSFPEFVRKISSVKLTPRRNIHVR